MKCVCVFWLQIKSPVEIVGLRQIFREADFSREVLIDDNIIVLLQPKFVVPKKRQMEKSSK